MALSAEEKAWIERQCGGRIVTIREQPRWRPHHFVEIERPNETVTVLARSERGEAKSVTSALMQHYDIAHEAGILRAIQGQGLKVPEMFGYSQKHRMILMEMLDGATELSQASGDDERRQIMFEYYEELARLHKLDVSKLDLPPSAFPRDRQDAAFAGKLRFSLEAYEKSRPGLKPQPLLDLAISWLSRNVPGGERRASLLQGDTGPGQFMFSGGHLTGLIDWELSHVGDRMLDLGVGRMRNMLYPTGPLREPLQRYEEAFGEPIDWPALRFYTVYSMLLTPLTMVGVMERMLADVNMVPRFGWDVTLRRGLCDALAEAIGIEVEPPELPLPGDEKAAALVDFLADQLQRNCLPIAADEADRYKMNDAIAVCRTLQLDARVGAKLLRDDLDDMGEVLGSRPASREEGLVLLSEVVDQNAAQLPDLIRLFSRIERRREYLWRPMMIHQSSGAFERLEPADLVPSSPTARGL